MKPYARAKLTRREFFNVYGISILLLKATESDREYLAQLLAPIAAKYLAITEHAVKAELRHLKTYGVFHAAKYYHMFHNIPFKTAVAEIVFRNKIQDWNSTIRTNISMTFARELFRNIDWVQGYGGEAWAKIADAAIQLRLVLPVTRHNIEKVISAIDHMNDLEHNNSLYLFSHCTFLLPDSLSYKWASSTIGIMDRCTKALRELYREQKKTSRRFYFYEVAK